MAELCMRFPGGLKKAVTLSYDDGVEQDKKLVEILVKYGLKATFNINSGIYAPEGTVYAPGTIHRRMTEKEVKALYAANGMEVATHGYTHPFLNRLPSQLIMKEIADDRRKLESDFDCIVTGHAYPFGAYNAEVINILREAGIVYARTVHSTHNFGIPEDWLELHPTCHHDDEKLMELVDKFLEKKDDWGYPMMFYLWGHAYEFEEHENWEVIENFAKKISGKSDIWYATNGEIYTYDKAFKSLVISYDITKVYNPSMSEIWFAYGGQEYSVKPGETISL